MSTRRTFLSSLSLPLLMSVNASLGIPYAHAHENVNNQSTANLVTSEEDWTSLESRRLNDPDLDNFCHLLLTRAKDDLRLPLLERSLIGHRLLSVSREFIRRALLWAFASRVSGNPVYRERAVKEMVNVCHFSNWNPQHYLDVAEMTTGVAIAYDWLKSDMSEVEKRVVLDGILKHGVAQARHGHSRYKMVNNWNQVCIGGMVLGALVLESEDAALCADVLKAARASIMTGLNPYAPDGVYPEGPAYWSFGSTYSILTVAALLKNRGTDWGILDAPGFLRSAEFYAHSIGPSGKHFNFADCHEGQEMPCAIVYLARHLKLPELIAQKRQLIHNKRAVEDRFAPLSALWWPAKNTSNSTPKSLDTLFSGSGPQPAVMWRSSWQDPNALWFAIKGGGAAHPHAHMDAGSFVLDCDGVRWARDLGMQNYNELERQGIDLWNMKQDSGRWRVFRHSAPAHNTLTLNGEAHSATGMAKLVMNSQREASIDMSEIFKPGSVKQAERRVRFMNTDVELIDSISGAQVETPIRWTMTTEAMAKIQGNTVILTSGAKSLKLAFEGRNLNIEIVDISEPQNTIDEANPNTRQLRVSSLPDRDGSWRLKTRFSRN